MPDHVVSPSQIAAARRHVVARVKRTPMLTSSTATRIVRETAGIDLDGPVFVKAEHLQVTGSFKPRGMSWKIERLSGAQREAGVVTLSAGNAAQAYAWAGAKAGVPVTVVMPAGAVRSKVEASRGYGAEVILHGAHVGESWAKVQELVDERGLTLVHPFDDPDVIAGHGSLGLEILDELPEVDAVVVGVGGGGLISGVAAALKESRPSIRIYGVEPEGSNAVSLALERNEVTTIEPVSVADGLNAPFAGEWTLAMCRRYLDGIVRLDDATILGGLRFAAERMKQVLEPAGAAALAAVLAGRIPLRRRDHVCVVASGGNVEIERLGELIGRARLLAPPG